MSGETQDRDVVKLLTWYGKHYFSAVPRAETLTFDRCMALSEMCTDAASKITRLTQEMKEAREALAEHHEQALAAGEDEYPDCPLFDKTVAALSSPNVPLHADTENGG